jgi:hypothetical protein
MTWRILIAGAISLVLLGCGGKPPASAPAAGPQAVDNAPSLYGPDGVLKADASDLKSTVVAATLDAPITPGQNVLWCSTFQLAWNELSDLLGGPIRLEGGSPLADSLNQRAATKADLDDPSYIAMAGLLSEGFWDKVRKARAEKFPNEPLHMEPSSRPQDKGQEFAAYACLVKNLEFALPFDSLDDRVMEFGGRPVRWFGFGEGGKHPKEFYDQLIVLDTGFQTEGNMSEAVVELKTKSPGDRLILAMVKPGATLGETVAEVRRRSERGRAPGESVAQLAVPKLDFDVRRRYAELEGKTVVGAKAPILDLKQDIRFRLNERGARLISEAYASMGGPVPRVLAFDRPFLILMERRDAKAPYFALWVDNPELLVPDTPKRAALMKNMPFDEVESFSEGLAAVRIGDQWTWIDTAGRFIAPLMQTGDPSLEEMQSCRRRYLESRAVASGKTTEPRRPESPKSASDDLTVTWKDKLAGFADRTGKFVIEPKFQYAVKFSDDRAVVMFDDRCGVIDGSGKFVVEPIFTTAKKDGFREGFAAVAMGAGPGEGGLPRLKWGFVDKSGKMLEIRP